MDVSIIIVNYNTENLLKDCINSIIENTKEISYEINVSDNCSKDELYEIIKENFLYFIVINNSGNIGYSNSNNKTLEIAKVKYMFK